MKITEHDIYSETNRLAFLATTAIERAMKRGDLKRSDVAERLGLHRSRVTKVLDGETNMTLRTLASFGLACGVRWHFGGEAIADGSVAIHWPPLEFTSASGSTGRQEAPVAYCLSASATPSQVPTGSGAQRASQDPPGPL